MLRGRYFESGTAGGEGDKPTGTAGANAKTPEELQAEIADLTAKHNQALAEKTGYEDTKQKLSDAQQMLARLMAERNATPPTGMRAGPFADIDAELEQFDMILSKVPNDPVTLRAKRDALKEREERAWELTRQSAWNSIQQVKPDALRDRAWQFFSTGTFGTPEAAVLAARGAVAAEEERTKGDEEARRKAETKPSTSTADSGGGGGTTKSKGPTTGSDYLKFLRENEGSKAARDLISEYDAGKVNIDWSR